MYGNEKEISEGEGKSSRELSVSCFFSLSLFSWPLKSDRELRNELKEERGERRAKSSISTLGSSCCLKDGARKTVSSLGRRLPQLKIQSTNAQAHALIRTYTYVGLLAAAG